MRNPVQLRADAPLYSQTLTTHPTLTGRDTPERNTTAMIALLSTSDTDLLSAKNANTADMVDFRYANPTHISDALLDEIIDAADIIIVRLLGGKRAWEDGLRRIFASGTPTIVVSGELAVDAELTDISTVPAGVVTTAHTYLAEGGATNLEHLYRFLSDTILLTGHGFDEPHHMPLWGHLERPTTETTPGQPRIAVLYYRAQHLAGNTAYIHALCDAIDAQGAHAIPIFTASLRQAPTELLDELATMDAAITTVLAAGGTKPATAQAGGDDEAWDVAQLAALDIPIIQGLALTSPRSDWAANDDGLTPLDVATQSAVPEFDGRIITVPFSFKEYDADGLISYVPDPERCTRLAGIAYHHARLRHLNNSDKKIVVMLSAYPTKHAQSPPRSARRRLQPRRHHHHPRLRHHGRRRLHARHH